MNNVFAKLREQYCVCVRVTERDKEDEGCCGVKAVEKVSNYSRERKTQSDDESNPAWGQ